jgi:hypothetical protein
MLSGYDPAGRTVVDGMALPSKEASTLHGRRAASVHIGNNQGSPAEDLGRPGELHSCSVVSESALAGRAGW